ncbi:MAG TPA: hypothetical protein VK851_09405 [Anaerolineales bacterium]|nr:hypothetical protein [Anaerolineales bacterium]
MLGFINGIFGIALLVAGRRMFWIFIGVMGFLTGAQLANNFLQGPEWLVIIIGLIVGILFAWLAVSLQAIAIGVAGFLAGGYVLSIIIGMLGLNDGILSWGIFIIGGIIGVLMVSFLFDWAVITLSSLAGASLVTDSFFPEIGSSSLIFIILFIAGIIIQGYLLRNENL